MPRENTDRFVSIYWKDRAGHDWKITGQFVEGDSRYELVALELQSNGFDGDLPSYRRSRGFQSFKPISSAVVRALPVGALEQALRHQLLYDLRHQTDISPAEAKVREAQGYAPLSERRLRQQLARARAKGVKPQHEPEHWQHVAEVYRRAWTAGESPSAAVAATYKISRSTARSWVQRCRQLGLLTATTERKPRA